MAKQTIKLKKYVDIINEAIAAEELLPGMLSVINGTGSAIKSPVPADGMNYPIAVVLEDELQGKTVSDAIESNAPVQLWMPVPGEEASLLLTNGEVVAIGDSVSAGAGGLIVKTVAPKLACGIALENVTATGDQLIKVRFI